jgi:glycosyltransferase involved in cell wall biosynthesis
VKLSVVVPTLDDAAHLLPCLRAMREVHAFGEILVIDGGSKDTSVERALECGARVWHGPTGFAERCDFGVRKSRSPIVALFTARMIPDRGWTRVALEFLSSPRIAGGTFSVTLDSRLLTFIETFRSRYAGGVYRAGGLVTSREVYEKAGGLSRAGGSFESFIAAIKPLGPFIQFRHSVHLMK